MVQQQQMTLRSQWLNMQTLLLARVHGGLTGSLLIRVAQGSRLMKQLPILTAEGHFAKGKGEGDTKHPLALNASTRQ